jgi:hypothetical protein
MLFDVLLAILVWAEWRAAFRGSFLISNAAVAVLLVNWLYSGDRRARQAVSAWLAANIAVNAVATAIVINASLGTMPVPLAGVILALLGVRFLIFGLALLALMASPNVATFLEAQASEHVPVMTAGAWVICGMAILAPLISLILR